MGDRANVCIQEDAHTIGVYFYLHWEGSELPDLVRQALGTPQARGRWQDHSYLTRIIGDRLSQAAGGPGRETGMGISTGIQDDNYGSVLVLDVRVQTVQYAHLDRDQDGHHQPKGEAWSFTEYATRSEAPAWPRDDEDQEDQAAAF